MQEQSSLIRIKRKTILYFAVILIALIGVTPVLADYLGPNRTVTETISVCKVILYECQYVTAKGIWKYKSENSWSCSSEGKPWRDYPSNSHPCNNNVHDSGYEYWEREDIPQTVTNTYPPATINSSLQNCTLQNGWCVTMPQLSLSGIEPVAGHYIFAIEGSLNGQTFACMNSSCSVPLNQGNNSLTYWALSSFGDSSTMGTLTAYVDSQIPDIAGAFTGISGSNGWYLSPVSFNGSAADATSGLASFTCTLDGAALGSCDIATINGEGSHTLVLTARDNAGLTRALTQNASIDTQNPTLNASINGTLGSNNWYTAAALNASASDFSPGSGLSVFEYNLDSNGWMTFPSSGTLNLLNGKHTVDLRAIDQAGHMVSSSKSFWLDTVDPNITTGANGTMGANDWYTTNPTITASANDDTSGVDIFEYSLDNNSWTAYTAPLTLGDGIHSLSFWVQDQAGLVKQADRTYQVDTRAPQIAGSISGILGLNGWYTSELILSASASDPIHGSGLDTFTYTLNGSAENPYTDPLTLSDGQHTVQLNARDKAGLSYSIEQTVQVDTIHPSLKIESTLPNWVKDKVTLNGTASDEGSGISKVEISTDGGQTWQNLNGTDAHAWSYVWDTSTGPNGMYEVDLRAIDLAGLTTQQTLNTGVDNHAPEISLPDSWLQWDTVTLDILDNESGLSEARVEITDPKGHSPTRVIQLDPTQFPLSFKWDRRFDDDTIAEAGTYDVKVTALDRLGNTADKNASIHILIDILPAGPTATPQPYTPEPTLTSLTTATSITSVSIAASATSASTATSTTSASTATSITSVSTATSATSASAATSITSISTATTVTSASTVTSVNSISTAASVTSASAATSTTSAPTATSVPLPKATQTAIVSVFGAIEPTTQVTPTPVFLATPRATSTKTNVLDWLESVYVSDPKEESTAQIGSLGEENKSPHPVGTGDNHILWGTAAAAAIASATTYIQEEKRKREEEKARQAALEAQEEERREKMQERKIEKMEAKRAQEQAWEKAREEARHEELERFDPIQIDRKIDRLEAEEETRRIASQIEAKKQVEEKKRQAEEKKKAEELKEGLVAYYNATRQGETATDTPPNQKSFWQNSWDWVDSHQTEIALGLGALVGVGAILLSGGLATPLVAAAWMAGAAAVAIGTTAVGTAVLNAHYGRDWNENLVRNVAIAGGAAAVVTGGWFLLQAATTGMGAYCAVNTTTCSRVEPVFNAIDTVEETWLSAKLGYQTWRHDPAAGDTALELEMEHIDGGMPGNSVLKELDQELAELSDDALYLIEQHGDDILPLLLKYQDDAVDIINAYGDEGIAILQKYGDDAIGLVKKYGTPAVKVLTSVGPEAGETLLKTLDDDVLDYAIQQGPDAIEALSLWSADDLETHGAELALRAKQDAKVLSDVKKLIALGPIDPKHLTEEQRVLIDAIAASSTQYADEGQVVLGKWVDISNGFVERAKDTGSVHYNPHPEMWKLLGGLGEENQGEVAWLINQQVVQTGINKGLPFEYTLNGVPTNSVKNEITAIQAIFSGKTNTEITRILKSDYMPIRMKELQELEKAGYEFVFDEVNNSYIFTLP